MRTEEIAAPFRAWHAARGKVDITTYLAAFTNIELGLVFGNDTQLLLAGNPCQTVLLLPALLRR